MKRIILHWTAGTYRPNVYEKEHYHYLVDGDGNVYNGKYKPEANLDCTTGFYAKHCGGGNTGAIGVALCAMLGFQNKTSQGRYPIKKVQFEAAMKLCASLAKKYNIKITPETILTHYEFGQKHPKTSSYGKIDIIFIPPYSWISQDDAGCFIRSKIRWYLEHLEG